MVSILKGICLLFALLWTSKPMQPQIQNTKRLIQLYQQKLELLERLANQSDTSSQSVHQNHSRPQNHSGTTRKIFKEQEQTVWQRSTIYGREDKFIPPHYVASGETIQNLITNAEYDSPFKGKIIIATGTEVTTSLDSNLLVYRVAELSNLEDQVPEPKVVKILPTHQKALWHRAAHFEDQFVEYAGNEVFFTSTETLTKKHFAFKSDIIALTSINQFKLLFVTRYHFGMLNTRSLHISSETALDGIAESALYHNGVLHILLKNHTLLTVAQENIVAAKNFSIEITKDNKKLAYVGGYLILYSTRSLCFHVLDFQPSFYTLNYLKQICLPSHTMVSSQLPSLDFQFFKLGSSFRLLLKEGQTDHMKMYEFSLPTKQAGNEYTFPWRYIVIVIGVASFLVFRSRGKKQRDLSKIMKKELLAQKGGESRNKTQNEGKGKGLNKMSEMELYLEIAKRKKVA